MSYSSEVLADSPLVFLKLDETSGTTAVDSSGNGRNGTRTGGAFGSTALAPGLGAALDLGVNDYVQIPNGAWMSVGATWAVEIVFQLDTLPGTGGARGSIVAARTNSDTSGDLQIQVYNNKIDAFCGTGTNFIEALGTATLVAGTPYHLVVTNNGSSLGIKLNTAADGSASSSGKPLGPVTRQIRIGNDERTDRTGIDGKVSSFALFGAPLLDARVAAHYAAAMSAPTADFTLTATTTNSVAAFTLATVLDATLAATTTTPVTAVTVATTLDAVLGATTPDPVAAIALDLANAPLDATLSATTASPVANLSLDATVDTTLTATTTRPVADIAVGFYADAALAATTTPPVADFTLVDPAATIALRLYLPSTGAAPATPDYSAIWERTGVAARRPLVTTPTDTEAVRVADTYSGTGTNDVLFRQYVSEEMLAGEIAGTFTVALPSGVDSPDVDARIQAHIRVVDPSGTTRGTLFPGDAGDGLGTDAPWSLTQIGIRVAEEVALSPVVALAGDRLVVELGQRVTHPDGASYTSRMAFGDPVLSLDTDVPLADAPTLSDGYPNLRPWIEFSDGGFLPLDPRDVSLAGTTARPVSAVTIATPEPTDPATDYIVFDGYGIATWEPPVVEPPHMPLIVHDRIAAEQYASVTMTGTRPTLTGQSVTYRARHRDRIIIAGRDVTFWRGVPTPLPAFGLVEPLLYGSGSMELPQVAACYETPGRGSLSWLTFGAPVTVQRVNADNEVVATDYRGIITGFDTRGRTLSIDLGGPVLGRAAMQDKQPPIFKRRNDLGWWWWQDIRSLFRPFEPQTGPTTGINLLDFGGMGLDQHMAELAAKGTNLQGAQWTCTPDESGTYRVHRKDRETIDATAYLDDAHTVANLRRDVTEEPNRVFASGTTPEGRRIRFGVYPVMADQAGVAYPNDDDRDIEPGDTDADTDSGGGVTAMLFRLSSTGYLGTEDRPGGYDNDAAQAVRALQRDAGLTATGTMDVATWDALYDVGVTGYSISGSHIEPAAQHSRVRRYDRTATGNINRQNPDWDRTALVVDRTIAMGSGVTRNQMQQWARGELSAPSASNWVGQITFNTGALIHGEHEPGDEVAPGDIMHARSLRPGMNLWLPLFDGGTLVHVSGVDVNSEGIVSATVDTQARDTMAVWEIVARNRENRRDPARAWIRSHRSSDFTNDAVTEFEEYGGTIDPIDLDAGWNVFPVVAGQEGTIARLRLVLDKPAEFTTAVFGRKIGRRQLANQIGDPLSRAGAKRWEQREKTLREFVLLYAAGDDQAPCGYFPGTKEVRTYTPMVANPDYNVDVNPDNPAYDNIETIPEQIPNPNYNPADPDNDQEFIDRVITEVRSELTGRWDDDAGFAYRTFGGTCVLWVAVYVRQPRTLNGGRIMWPQMEAGS